ncbi:DNA segregation ATPase FtsK/SpoIIIE-like protein [Bartonella heixiaziensis]
MASIGKLLLLCLRDRKALTSYIQRCLGIGYNYAASLIERMEEEGIISPANHAEKREILVSAEEKCFWNKNLLIVIFK